MSASCAANSRTSGSHLVDEGEVARIDAIERALDVREINIVRHLAISHAATERDELMTGVVLADGGVVVDALGGAHEEPPLIVMSSIVATAVRMRACQQKGMVYCVSHRWYQLFCRFVQFLRRDVAWLTSQIF